MNIASRFPAEKQPGGGWGEKPQGLAGGDPTPSYKIQADFEAFRDRAFLFCEELAAFGLFGRLRASIRVPWHVLPRRSLRIRIAGQYPTTGPVPLSNVQRAILDWMGRIILNNEVGEDRGSLLRAEEWEREIFG